MKALTALTFFSSFIISVCSYAQTDTTARKVPFIWADEMPKFPGGEEALLTYIQHNLNYPKEAREAGISGRVTVRFVIDETGQVINAMVPKGMGIGGGCDEEAVRVVSSLPKWGPGKKDGVLVPVFFTVPIIFKLTAPEEKKK